MVVWASGVWGPGFFNECMGRDNGLFLGLWEGDEGMSFSPDILLYWG